VIDVATLGPIRRWALREQLSIREMARRTGLSRNTIKKYLRSDQKEPSYARRLSGSRLDPYAEKLAGWLKTEAGKNRKQRRMLKQMHAELAALGCEGSCNRVAAFARVWAARRHEAERRTGRGTFVPLVFVAGETFQCDWSEDRAVLAGERAKLQVAHFKLSHSRAFLARAYPQQTHEMPFAAHSHALRIFGGVAPRSSEGSTVGGNRARGRRQPAPV
jgi:transposase